MDSKNITEIRSKIREQIVIKKVEQLRNRLRKKSLEKIKNLKKPILKKHYFICTFGGCGEHILKKYLSFFGKTDIVYSRWPPRRLRYVKNNLFTREEIEKEELKNYVVIYLYRNPVDAVISKHFGEGHLLKIQASSGFGDNEDLEKDFFKLGDFFGHYFIPKENYTIYCIKSEDLCNIKYNSGITLKKFLNINNLTKEEESCLHDLCMEYNSDLELKYSELNLEKLEILKTRYKDLNEKIEFLPFIFVNEPHKLKNFK